MVSLDYMNVWAKQRKQGFTIVELLIVIVVIGILAAISVVAYNGVQFRASDTRRIADITKLQQGLEIYRQQNDSFPAATSANSDSSGWEVSYKTGDFLPALVSSGVMSTKLVDPLNTSTYFYRYYKYAAGQYSCPTARGEYYVLQIRTLQAQSGNGGGPGFQCSGSSGRNWGSESAYTVGGYLN